MGGSRKDQWVVLVPSCAQQVQELAVLCREPCSVPGAVELAFSQASEMTVHVSSPGCPEVSLLVLGTSPIILSLRAVEEPEKGSRPETEKSA